MGKPKSIKPATIDTTYGWGEFGSANKSGVSFNPATSANIQTAQSGIGQYLNELINPSYESESFKARQVKKEIQSYGKNQYSKGYEAAKKEFAKQAEKKVVSVKSTTHIETPKVKKPIESMSLKEQLEEEMKSLI